jgi:hypothetical protein
MTAHGPDPNREPPVDPEAATSDAVGDAPRAGGRGLRWFVVFVLAVLVLLFVLAVLV